MRKQCVRKTCSVLAVAMITGVSCLVNPIYSEAKVQAVYLAVEGKSEPQGILNTALLTQFTDYQEDAWWAHTMSWAIANDIVNGYTASTGERTLQPNHMVTEAEYVTMLLRLLDGDSLHAMETLDAWWASAAYQLAIAYNLPVKGSNSSDRRELAAQAITRGETAVIMVSGILGRRVSEREAVQYLYDHNLSAGRDPLGKTFTSFGAQDHLTRAEAIAFLQRLDAKGTTLQVVAQQNEVLAKLYPVIEQYQLTGKVIINNDVEIIDSQGILLSTYRGPNDLRTGHRVATYISRHENAIQIMADIAVILGVRTEANHLAKEINDYFVQGGPPRTFDFDGQQVEVFFGGSTNYMTVAWE